MLNIRLVAPVPNFPSENTSALREKHLLEALLPPQR
jgi:hypothetical protein